MIIDHVMTIHLTPCTRMQRNVTTYVYSEYPHIQAKAESMLRFINHWNRKFQLTNLVAAADPFVTGVEKRGNLEQKSVLSYVYKRFSSIRTQKKKLNKVVKIDIIGPSYGFKMYCHIYE